MDFNAMRLPELKAEAKSRKLKGYSTLNKADLITALESDSKPTEKPSFIDALKASFAVNREARSAKGRKAGRDATVTLKTPAADKAMIFRLQRGSETATLTKRQARRVRKTERKTGAVEFTYS